jgi:hypothetical protein
VLPPRERQAFDEEVAAARLSIGDATFDALWAEGGTLAQDGIVAYAIA